jgi:hypothetical protein
MVRGELKIRRPTSGEATRGLTCSWAAAEVQVRAEMDSKVEEQG